MDIKKAHHHTKKDTLQRLEADLYVKQAMQIYNLEFRKMLKLTKFKKMNTNFQRERFFPMPDYDLSDNKVKVTISGKILDIEYARVLAKNKNLTLDEIMMLDKVQKKYQLNDFEEKTLKAKKLIEGRKPNYYIGLKVAESIGQKAAYSKNTAFNKQDYLDWIIKSLKEHQFLERKDIDQLLWDKLPEWMDEKQKKVKITNLIAELRKGKD